MWFYHAIQSFVLQYLRALDLSSAPAKEGLDVILVSFEHLVEVCHHAGIIAATGPDPTSTGAYVQVFCVKYQGSQDAGTFRLQRESLCDIPQSQFRLPLHVQVGRTTGIGEGPASVHDDHARYRLRSARHVVAVCMRCRDLDMALGQGGGR